MKTVTKNSGKVYRVNKRENTARIMAEGLMPLAKNRTKEMEVVDIAFDLVAERIGIEHRRKGSFAWPSLEQAKRCILSDIDIIEIDVDADRAIVLHQAWMNLGWGMVELVFNRIPAEYKEEFRNMPARELFDEIKEVRIWEGRVEAVFFELGELYWRTAVPLKDYNGQTAKELTKKVINRQKEFTNLMPGLDHEVALGTEIIEPARMRVVI